MVGKQAVQGQLEHQSPGWQARRVLRFAHTGDATVLQESTGYGPLRIQRPFQPEGKRACQVVLLHPPGGLVGGDRLEIEVALAPSAQVLLTTPAANRFYRSAGAEAMQQVELNLAEDAWLEWLPQETLVYDQAIGRQTLKVELAPGAHFIGWEITRFGRSAHDERFTRGSWHNSFEIWQAGLPLWLDRQALEGGSSLLDSPYGLAGFPVLGSFAFVGASLERDLLDALREQAPAPIQGEFGLSRLPQGLLCRYRGRSSAEARSLFTLVWDQLRRAFVDRPACIPRIWHT